MEAFERLAEQRILEAMEQGEFDNLPGAGKPLILNDYPFVPDELWMAHKILRNAGCLPPEVEERKEISRLEELLAGLQDDAERTQAQKRLAGANEGGDGPPARRGRSHRLGIPGTCCRTVGPEAAKVTDPMRNSGYWQAWAAEEGDVAGRARPISRQAAV